MSVPNRDLVTRCVLVTGVTRGLGRALVDRLAERGHTVLGCGRNPRRIDELRRTFGEPHHFGAVDVADDAQVRNWASSVLASRDAPDLLVNNAGVINRNAALWEVPAEEFQEVIDVNVKGPAAIIRHFLPLMIRAGRGVVVNMSSGWGRSVSPEVAPYCASKWAIEGLTRALALELPKGMAAVALDPGVVDTDMLRLSMGGEAGSATGAEAWSHRAIDVLLRLGPKDNGKTVRV